MNKLYESSSRPLVAKSKRVLSGPFAEFDVLNQNGRIYPKKIYENALKDLMPKIESGRLLGECDHPDYDEVRLANVSHVIRECKVVGNTVMGSIELLDTPSGKILQALNEAGIPIGISSRAFGETKRIKEGSEVTSLNLVTYDAVADPSFGNAVLTESAKANLYKELDAIEKTLPLNESFGSDSLRTKISDIKDKIDKKPTITSSLIESIGKLTLENQSLNDEIKDLTSRNESIRENMSVLQDSYNELAKINEANELKLREARKSYEEDIQELKESYEDEIVTLRKELAIEKRGLSKTAIMPILEGLTSEEEIDDKLNSLKHIKSRRYETVSKESITSLTEGTSRNTKSRLTNIISRV